MDIRILLRQAAVLALVLFISGCVGPTPRHYRAASPTNECYRNQAACSYDGAYEPGEREYAEQEAKRLNQAQVQKLRRGW